MIEEAGVVIIGAGAFGSSTAYHLAALGREGIVLIDAHDVASQTSPRAAGLVKQIQLDPDMSRLSTLSAKKIMGFPEETGQPLTIVQSGSVSIARGEPDEAVIKAEIAAGQSLGLEAYSISLDEMSLLAPLIRPRDVRIIAYIPSDLYIEEPGQLPLGYARAAEQRGATLLPNTPVTGIGIEEDRVTKVITAQGEIRTPIVIDAAGAWARLVAERAGLRVPLVPVRHQLCITERIPGVEASHAICRIYDAGVYMRSHQGGLMIGGYEADPQFHDMQALPPDFAVGDLPLDMRVLERLIQSIRKQLLIDALPPIREHRGGLPTMTPDGRPIVGAVPSVDGFYVASGCCVGGFSICPAVGEMLAELVHTGLPSLFLDAFSIARFGTAFDSEQTLRAACALQYTHRYTARPQG
ncbi:MAG TPA: FAD-binding oxidoreductase [bacterium]|nr:FAD-binding oxidoreductase [bacterium]